MRWFMFPLVLGLLASSVLFSALCLILMASPQLPGGLTWTVMPDYRVWIIPLASGSTSIGIVTDASMHSFNEMNLFERALSWLHRYEPQCAEEIEQHRTQIQDFRVMKDYSYSCEQVFSADRWCLVGEAAVAIDPLYSSGGDLIAIGNGLTCDLVNRSLDGQDIEELAVAHNQMVSQTPSHWAMLKAAKILPICVQLAQNQKSVKANQLKVRPRPRET